ncbi:MAG: hypothetical protein A2Y62_07880 [Candidatus Fischerbacteria bacterium RBG_13_37_8]|uniref:VanZ-like domain-containing protein n=1 Tax=Candidatus Fischerbacteria bacterium RBG_13_37_8 TaxID=1817863 RepID=A0A1F5V936_9BACT|nr:MAG: hypothetical protein A2Y62_07880 [Candidatus Fischerbacteria bacterium RBG_13_37_8]
MKILGNLFFYKFPAILYIVLIYYLSSLSHPPVPPNVSDIILHIIEFFLLFVLVYRALNSGIFKLFARKTALLSVFFSLLYGGLDELHQYFVPERVASLKDFISDSTGILLGLLVVFLIHAVLLKSKT